MQEALVEAQASGWVVLLPCPTGTHIGTALREVSAAPARNGAFDDHLPTIAAWCLGRGFIPMTWWPGETVRDNVPLPDRRALVDATQWRTQAECRDTIPAEWSYFFPARGEASTDARSWCQQCPVAAQCLAEEMSRDRTQWHGILGGLSVRQRKSIVQYLRQVFLGREVLQVPDHVECDWVLVTAGHRAPAPRDTAGQHVISWASHTVVEHTDEETLTLAQWHQLQPA